MWETIKPLFFTNLVGIEDFDKSLQMATLGQKNNPLSPSDNSGLFNEADATRTRNLRIDSPMDENHNSRDSKDLHRSGKGAYKPAYKNISEITENKTQLDAKNLPEELAEIVTVWHKLPEHIKAAIKALVQTHSTEKK